MKWQIIWTNLRKKEEQQNEDSFNKIRQLEGCLTATLDEFQRFIHQAILAYTE